MNNFAFWLSVALSTAVIAFFVNYVRDVLPYWFNKEKIPFE